MRRIAILPVLGLALVLGAPWSYAHNSNTQPDCPVQILKSAAPKPDVYWSIDASGSMSSACSGCGGVPKYLVARQAITNLVNDPQVGGTAINYGYQEWSSQRAGSCQAKRYVDIINDGDTSAAVAAAVAGMSPWGGTPQNAGLIEANTYYTTIVKPNDTVACRQYYVAMVTDGGWNCTGNPCPEAVVLANNNVAIIACGFDTNVPSLTCMANAHPNGAFLLASSYQQLFDGFKNILKTVLTTNVTIVPSVTGTIKDPVDPNYVNIQRNATVVATVTVPSFEGHFLAYNVLKPDLADPTKTKLLNDFTLLWDAGLVSRPPNLTTNGRKIFTTNHWATCWHPAGGNPTVDCTSAVPAPAHTNVPFVTGMNPSGLFGLGYSQAQADAVIANVRGPKGGANGFMIWASTGAAGSLQVPSNSDIQDSTYQAFVASQSPSGNPMSKRETIYYAGTDSGGVHAFSARTDAAKGWTGGLEKWMYIPRENLSRLKNLGGPIGQIIDAYTYFAAGTPVVFDVKTGQGWKTLLTFGLGNGGRSYYGVDVTWPDQWTAGNPFPTVLWAFTDHDNANNNALILDKTMFGSVGMSLSAPANNNPVKNEIVFGSGVANDQFDQGPPVNHPCVGNPLVGQEIGHRLFRLRIDDGALLGSGITTGAIGLNGGTNVTSDTEDILRTHANGMNRFASGILTEANNIETTFALDKYVVGGSRGHVYLWDGVTPTLVHMTTAATVPNADPGIVRPVTQIPLVLSPQDVTGICKNGANNITVATYFGTGDDATKGNQQYIYSVDLSGGVLPSFAQLPGSPFSLGANEIVTGNPIVARINSQLNQSTGASGDSVVLFIGYTASSNPCGGGFSRLYAIKGCDPTKGGWDANGDGQVTGADRLAADLGPGKATAIDVSHGALMVTGAQGIFNFTNCAQGGQGTNFPCMRKAPAGSLPEIYNWKIRDVN